jgi:hypothetical protein
MMLAAAARTMIRKVIVSNLLPLAKAAIDCHCTDTPHLPFNNMVTFDVAPSIIFILYFAVNFYLRIFPDELYQFPSYAGIKNC